MKRISIQIVSLCLLAASCGGSQPESGAVETAQTAVPDPSATVDEDALIMRLSSDMTANPQTPELRDRNAILNYAIDHLIDGYLTPSGLFYQTLYEGQGALLAWGDRVRVHYKGYFLEDGRVFDSSYQRGKPIEFYIGNMIAGWNEGLQLLRPGGKALLLIPAHLAYGEEGLKDSKGVFLVPPRENLAFELEVLEKVE